MLSALFVWPRLRRLFHFEGKLGDLRYEARLRIFDLSTAASPANTTESDHEQLHESTPRLRIDDN